MFEPTWTWPNFTFGQLIMWIGANNYHYMTSYGLDEWFRAMFEPTWTWPNFTFGQLFMWIGANNGQIWLSMGYMRDSEQCSNRFELDLISLLVNFSCELRKIMTRYDFLLDLMLILDNFLCEFMSHIWPFRLNITFGWLQKLNPGYEICIISYQVNLSNKVSAMFNSLMPSLNSRYMPFVVFLGGFPSRCQNLSGGAIRPGGLLFLHILDFNLKKSYQIASLFHMCIDMGERIAGKQDRPSLIIEDPPPPRAPQIVVFNCFPLLCIYMSPLCLHLLSAFAVCICCLHLLSAFAVCIYCLHLLTFWCPRYP